MTTTPDKEFFYEQIVQFGDGGGTSSQVRAILVSESAPRKGEASPDAVLRDTGIREIWISHSSADGRRSRLAPSDLKGEIEHCFEFSGNTAAKFEDVLAMWREAGRPTKPWGGW